MKPNLKAISAMPAPGRAMPAIGRAIPVVGRAILAFEGAILLSTRAIIAFASLALVSACHSNPKLKPAAAIKHLVRSGWAGSAEVYADRLPNRAILQEDGGDSGKTTFYCLKIGLYDSTDASDPRLEAARRKYYQLEMYKDWVLVQDGDSIAPVFYQPMPQLQNKLTEQVLVYEIPKGFAPAALVYKDPYKLLGNRQTMFLHENQN